MWIYGLAEWKGWFAAELMRVREGWVLQREGDVHSLHRVSRIVEKRVRNSGSEKTG